MTHKNIEEYIARFMEGETTNAEEQAIYRYFRTADVPEHLKPYAPMFAWYEEGMPEDALPMAKETEVPVMQKKPVWRRIPMEVWSMGIAAMLVVGIGLGVVLSFGDKQHEDWSCYEGSYMVVNGKRITDKETLIPMILETLAKAEAIEKCLEAQLDENERIEKYVEEKEAMLANY